MSTLRVKPPALDIGESEFENKLLAAAVHFGWRVHAERKATVQRDDSGRSTVTVTPIKGHPGYVDVTMVHPLHGIVFAELKTRKGVLGPGQPEWIGDLARHDRPGTPVLVELWRPTDWPYIEVCLRDGIEEYRSRYRRPVV